METEPMEKICSAVVYSFYTMVGLVLLAVIILSIYFIVENSQVKRRQKKKIKENEELLLKETEPLKKAIDQDLKDLARVELNPEFVKRFNKSIGRAQRKLWKADIWGDELSNERVLTGDFFNLRGDRSDLWGNVKDLYGDCSGIWGDCSGIWGDCSGLKGCCTGLVGYCVEQLKE